MISLLAILLILVIVLLSLAQTLLVINYRWFHRDAKQPGIPDVSSRSLPQVAVILCLRGREDSIPECLAGLVGQAYSNYKLHIAFDSDDDPAVDQVKEFFADHNAAARLHFFEPKQNCSYKCSGIVHVLEQLEDDMEIVAFCDGDAIVDEKWLEELVAPMLNDHSIGATTGNRWFTPYDSSVGGLIRKLWNSAAVVQMQAYDIAWGGTMAVRRSTIEKCNLKEVWSRSFCEDTSMASELRQQGLELHRVPGLVIEDRETITISQCIRWIARQLLTVRLHHPDWSLVMAHGIATGLATIVTPILILILAVTGYRIEAGSLFFAWLIYQLVNYGLLWMIEKCNRDALSARNSETLAVEGDSSTTGILAFIAVQFAHPLALLDTMTMNKVTWRNVDYFIRGKRIGTDRSDMRHSALS
jgi:cellulose synthase/poly-beta-1,6-N-acetylglucosamine synthase-like glycosyltransferase